MSTPLLVPQLAEVRAVHPVTPDTLLFEVQPQRPWSYLPGQFAELSVLGVGECPISITSTPTRDGPLEFAIREVGLVTRALHNLAPGDRIGLRGPFGRPFPLDQLEGKDILFIAGGIGLAPLRSLINYVLDRRADHGAVDIVYGARTPELLCFAEELGCFTPERPKGARGPELDEWRAVPGTRVHVTVDAEAPGWTGRVGFVPAVVADLGLPAEGRIAVACGPPIMIKIVLADLAAAGYPDEAVITTLELKMKCGVGKCGRCNIGPKFVCLDGPVFRLDELRALPAEY